MEEIPEKLENNWRNPDGTLKPGHPPMGGRPQGSLDFKTKFYKVIDKLAKQNNITAEEVEEQLLLVGYKKAKDGDYSFYRDLMDRIHGRPIQKSELTGKDGKDLPTPIMQITRDALSSNDSDQ